MKRQIFWAEFGFLFAIFMAPWGPVLRYLGWLFAFVGLGMDLRKGKSFRGVLDPFISRALLLFLSWAVVSTSLFKHDLYSWGKGISLALEFSFAIWLAAYVFQEQGALRRWKHVWTLGIALSLVHLIGGELLLLTRELFSNINTIGIYACIIVPFVLALFFESENRLLAWGYALLFWGSILALIVSFSSAAWIAGGIALLLQLWVSRISSKEIKILVLSFIACSVVTFLVLTIWLPEKGVVFASYFQREVQQILSINDIDNFSTHRIYIWKGAWNLIKEKPLIGWGWGDFSQAFAQVNASWWNPEITKLSVYRDDAHSMYLNIAIFGGIPTLLLVIAIHLRGAWLAFQKGNCNEKGKYIYYAIFASITSQLIYSLAGDMFSFRFKGAILYWTLIGIVSMKDYVK